MDIIGNAQNGLLTLMATCPAAAYNASSCAPYGPYYCSPPWAGWGGAGSPSIIGQDPEFNPQALEEARRLQEQQRQFQGRLPSGIFAIAPFVPSPTSQTTAVPLPTVTDEIKENPEFLLPLGIGAVAAYLLRANPLIAYAALGVGGYSTYVIASNARMKPPASGTRV